MKFLDTSRFSSISYNLISRFVLIIKWNDCFYKSILEWSLTRFLCTWIRNCFLFFFLWFDNEQFPFVSNILYPDLESILYLDFIRMCVCVYITINWTFDIFHVSKKRFTTFHFLCENFDIRKNIFHQIESVIFLRNKFSLLCFFVWIKKFVLTRR